MSQICNRTFFLTAFFIEPDKSFLVLGLINNFV